jgi:hypothetical protein
MMKAVRGTFDFKARNDKELTFVKGESIMVLANVRRSVLDVTAESHKMRKVTDEFYEGVNGAGQSGLFPTSFVVSDGERLQHACCEMARTDGESREPTDRVWWCVCADTVVGEKASAEFDYAPVSCDAAMFR